MSKWINGDGLIVKFGSSEGDPIKGGTIKTYDNVYKTFFTVDSTDALSATYSVLGSASASTDGGLGVTIPKGARIKAIEVLVQTAFTSSGTIASSTFSIGLKQLADLSTEIDHDGFLTASFVGSNLDAVGERAYVTVGSTGAGALIGTTLASNGVIAVANTAHASHPYTAGKAVVTVEWFYP
jgi:hypothetical protein